MPRQPKQPPTSAQDTTTFLTSLTNKLKPVLVKNVIEQIQREISNKEIEIGIAKKFMASEK